MSIVQEPLLELLSEEALWRLESICIRFEEQWQSGNRPSLEEFLIDLEGPERLASLAELLRLELYYRRQANENPSPEEYETRFPDATLLINQVFRPSPRSSNSTISYDQEGSIQAIATADYIPNRNDCLDDEILPASMYPSRYQKIRFHAAGNLGEVYIAEDSELHREVALKEIQNQYAHRKDRRKRFVLEGEVTGRLEHPGIVPVYGMGTYPDGRPYYAMRFIQGETFRQAIHRFHKQSPVRFDSSEFRQLLGRFVAVCQAMAYAHSRGILHRDLKPDNIMLGKFGETLIVDWGLAKVIDSDPTGDLSLAEEGLLRPSNNGWSETQTGAIVGTPAFMSPEQAAGQIRELSPATDIYSLGATLYAILTGSAPFSGPLEEVLQKVEQGNWVRARQINSNLPVALDAVCSKSMALKPQDRYCSVIDIAHEVEHWLADEPVQAHRETLSARIRRWMRKHPQSVTGIGVLLLALVVGLTAGAILLEQNKREAEDNFRITREAAQKFLVSVNEEELLNEPGMQPLREKLLMEALDYYRKFLDKRPDDPRVRQEQAEANRQLGEVYLEADRKLQARTLLEKAHQAFEELAQGNPNDFGVRRGLGQALLAITDFENQSANLSVAHDRANQAIELFESLRPERPDDTRLMKLLGRAYDLRSAIRSQIGRVPEAIEDNRQAAQLFWDSLFILFQENKGENWSRLLHEGTTDEPKRGFLSGYLVFRSWVDRGLLLQLAGRKAEALQSLLTAIRSGKELQNHYSYLQTYNPRMDRLRLGLAVALLHAGEIQIQLGRPGLGRATLFEALQHARGFLQDIPSLSRFDSAQEENRKFQEILFQAAGYLAIDLYQTGETIRALPFFQESESVAKEALRVPCPKSILLGAYGKILFYHGCLEEDWGNRDRAMQYWSQAQTVQQRAIRQANWDDELKSDWLSTQEKIARSQFRAKQMDRESWIASQRKILNERANLARKYPEMSHYQGKWGASTSLLTEELLQAIQSQDALQILEEVLPILEQSIQADRLSNRVEARKNDPPQKSTLLEGPRGVIGGLNPYQFPSHFDRRKPFHELEDAQLRRIGAELLVRKFEALWQQGQQILAQQCLDRAITIVEELIQGTGNFVASLGSWVSSWQTLPRIYGLREPCYLYDLACYCTLASRLAENGTLQEKRATQAIRELIDSGFDNPHRLRNDPRFALLNQRKEFQELIGKLEAKMPHPRER